MGAMSWFKGKISVKTEVFSKNIIVLGALWCYLGLKRPDALMV